MSNTSNLDQFNAQVKRTSERLRGDSTTPPEVQANESMGDQVTTVSGTDAGGTLASASPAAPSQSRRKGPGGKRGATEVRPDSQGNTTQAERGTTNAPPTTSSREPAASSGETHALRGGDTLDGLLPRKTQRQPQGQKEKSETQTFSGLEIGPP